MKSTVRFMALGVALLVCQVFMSVSAQAQATRTWVSGVGDDANPCSRTAPCKTFAGAISKTAAGGEINVLDPGGFGAVTITKSITIDGGGVESGVLASGTNGIIVNAAATDVVRLRGLDINGIGTGLNGIRFLAGKELHVEGCNIYGFAQKGIDVASGSANHLVFVQNSVIRNNTNAVNGGGILVKPTGGAVGTLTLDNVTLDANKFGVRIEDGTTAFVRNTRASGSPNGGGLIALNASDMFVENSSVTGNASAGINSQSLSRIYLSSVTVTRNNPGIFAAGGGQVISFGNNRIVDNVVDGAPTSTIAPQ